MLLGFILILGGLIWGMVKATVVTATRINDDYIWIRGVCKEYLASLPLWQE